MLVANAELLSGLVIAQLAGRDAFRLRRQGVHHGYAAHERVYAAPEFMINMPPCAAWPATTGCPSFSFGGCSDAKSFDEQASLEGALWI
jgi:hypothetical protein